MDKKINNKKLILISITFLILILFILPSVLAIENFRFQKIATIRTGSPVILAVRYKAILTHEQCTTPAIVTFNTNDVDPSTIYSPNQKIIQGDWNVKEWSAEGFSTEKYCEMVSSSQESATAKCSLIGDERCADPHFGGTSFVFDLRATLPYSGCTEKFLYTTNIRHGEGDKWCRENIAKLCQSNEIIETDCSLSEETCYRGECESGCIIPGISMVYPIGDIRCTDKKNLEKCNEDKEWEIVKGCTLGCRLGGTKCTLSSAQCVLKDGTEPGKVIISSVRHNTIHCLDAKNWSGRNLNGKEEIINFVNGIYICEEGIWKLNAECSGNCKDSLSCGEIIEGEPDVIEIEEPPRPKPRGFGELFTKIWGWFIGLLNL